MRFVLFVVVAMLAVAGCASARSAPTARQRPTTRGTTASPTASPTVSSPSASTAATRARPTSAPPSHKLCGAPRNPFGYNFCGSQPGHDAALYSPDHRICRYFACAPGFFHQHGYVIECQDGMFTQTGGTSRECSGHGGFQSVVFN